MKKLLLILPLCVLLNAVSVNAQKVTATWTDVSTDETSFVMERCLGPGCQTFAPLNTTGPNATTLTDTDVVLNGTYCYRLKAVNEAGPSTYSNEACITLIPVAPTGTLVCMWQPPPATGLVAAYHFNETSGATAADTSDNTNIGTLNGGAIWATEGKFKGAASFNGTTARITIPGSSSLDLTTAMTLEAWVYPTALAKFRPVIMKEGSPYGLYAHTSQGKPTGYVAPGGKLKAAYGVVLPLNTWSHLATTYDGTTVRLYQNGEEVGNLVTTGSIPISTRPLQIGGNTQYGEAFAGRIDDVRIYNRALTAGEIQTDMSKEVQ